jgi:hypothetical protein
MILKGLHRVEASHQTSQPTMSQTLGRFNKLLISVPGSASVACRTVQSE